jgi:hemoglobin
VTIAPAASAGTELHAAVTEASIAIMVERFYASVHEHPTLGPVFNERLEGRWDKHLAQMKDFWSSVLLRSGRYEGYPLGAHFGVPGIEKRHFGDWLALFEETLRSVYQPDVAAAIHGISGQFAQRFSYALFDR